MEASPPSLPTLHAWRHAPALGAAGRCIGRTDLPIDPRRAKRLAHRIRAFARRQGLPRIVVTSPLARACASGRWLARWGWQHRVDAVLAEIDFGRWEGGRWADVPRADFDAWCDDFSTQRPGAEGESIDALLQRVRAFDPGAARVLVTHGGWLSAAAWLAQDTAAPTHARDWPVPPCHGQHRELPWPPRAARRAGG